MMKSLLVSALAMTLIGSVASAATTAFLCKDKEKISPLSVSMNITQDGGQSDTFTMNLKIGDAPSVQVGVCNASTASHKAILNHLVRCTVWDGDVTYEIYPKFTHKSRNFLRLDGVSEVGIMTFTGDHSEAVRLKDCTKN